MSEYARFLAHWRRFPSHEYLERAAGLLAGLGVGPDDPRLCAGTPNGSGVAFPITLNQRYVLAAMPRRAGTRFGVILASGPPEAFAFRPFRDEAAPPVWRTFDDLAALDDPALAAEWRAGAAYELGRRARSGYRRLSNGFLAEILTDEAARAAWREEAERVAAPPPRQSGVEPPQSERGEA